MRAQPFAVVVVLASVMGFGFAAVSTYDSVAHLDRQVHGIHCSYFLGMGETDAQGSSGCYATLMSPYSSIFRGAVWGGVPVALAGMSVFGFLVFFCIWMMIRNLFVVRVAGFLLLATGLPLITSIVMGYLAIVSLDAVCKMCVGIYVSSALAFVAAVLVFVAAKKNQPILEADGADPKTRVSFGVLAGAFCLGVLFVALPFGAYAAMAPDFSHYVGNCGSLKTLRDTEEILVPYGPQDRDVEMIEVLDPLCQACAMLEKRMASMPESAAVSRRVLLFPLDNACNWMVDESIHPGACAVSEAVLCADDAGAGAVLDWAVENQEEILAQAKQDPAAAARLVTKRFPALASCIGGASVRARLNLALRWAVKNQLQVLTPQIYIRGMRLCDEDTDLGLDFALSKLIARARSAPAFKEQPLPEEKQPKTGVVRPRPAPAATRPEPPAEGLSPPPVDSKEKDGVLEEIKGRIDAIEPPAPLGAPPAAGKAEPKEEGVARPTPAPDAPAPPKAPPVPPQPAAPPPADPPPAAPPKPAPSEGAAAGEGVAP